MHRDWPDNKTCILTTATAFHVEEMYVRKIEKMPYKNVSPHASETSGTKDRSFILLN